MRRLKLTLAYDGTDFCGWQFQPKLRTVQGELEKAVAVITGVPVRAHGSGRTDSGVHARGQVVHLDLPETRISVPWQKALNSLLPDDVTVLDVAYVDDDFHSRFSAVEKCYTYSLWIENSFLLPWRRQYVWKCGPLDFDALDQAMEYFLGVHDFAAFQNAGTEVSSTVRNILDFKRRPGESEHEIILEVVGTGFLKQMVRNMVGCLVKIARGKEDPSFVRSLLEMKDRTLAPATAPARGLCLDHVYYGEVDRGGPDSGRNKPDKNGHGQ
ncbi:tRNA pseudouridine(38-40) synthase TruA [Maridesulfovibrio zosterae]|uniref:tRNA pseudouridine(38-40) synthase TruA n=1 Tax=Maridesulfovibrio zosterae TaxID=82171 RepID=UPI0004834299|nr:tRNA pseudouridine(38-40) synthase TruA [Maridesulfovibrio zosterae]